MEANEIIILAVGTLALALTFARAQKAQRKVDRLGRRIDNNEMQEYEQRQRQTIIDLENKVEAVRRQRDQARKDLAAVKRNTRRLEERCEYLATAADRDDRELIRKSERIQEIEDLADKWKAAANAFRDCFYQRNAYDSVKASNTFANADIVDRTFRTGQRAREGGEGQS